MDVTPSQAASLANSVYALTKTPSLEDAKTLLNATFGGQLAFCDENMLKGKTGGPGYIKVRTAFGYLLVGQDRLKGKAFVLFRGTQYLADWLTNFNVNAVGQKSYFGKSVHAGFNESYKSMLPQIKPFVDSLPLETEIYCIGHSLGGALATIAAEWIAAHTTFRPILISYGSPRVGLSDFSENLTDKLVASSIFRVYHKTDIVPCIPFWPYHHTPYVDGSDSTVRDYHIYSPGFFPAGEWHDMGKYTNSVKGLSWEQLFSSRKEKKTSKSIMSWLEDKTFISCSSAAIEWLDAGINFVISKCIEVDLHMFSSDHSSCFTVMDRLAYILSKGIDLSKNLCKWILALINKVSQFLGHAKELKVEQISRHSMRRLFTQLSNRVNNMAKQTLNDVLAEGRAI